MSDKLGKKQARNLCISLRQAREAATMERMSIALNGGFPSDQAYSDQVRADTKIFRQSWIISPIDEVLAALEKFT